MNNFPSTSTHIDAFEDDEIFDDSTILANFEKDSFRENTNKVYESNNKSLNKSDLNVSALCCDEEISGFDKLTGNTWIYPTNYPVRDYQFNIIKAAILKNTLVSLPTGLGKTFIAAVLMYNFYRWYPVGKIVFTAPTRPLVAQQIDACYNIIAIPPNDTIEMTGHMQINTRKIHWQNKRVFFATPQVIYNDIKSGICPAEKIRCLVIDEAHRARGNYAYCQIVSTLTEMGHKTYRVLALSATPGSKVDDVINVVKNLHIAHLELRTENCIDVAPYSHARKINTVIIQLGPELTQLRQQYVEILDGYARRLKQLNILPHNLGNLSKGRVVMLYKEFQTKERHARHPQHNYIMKDFTLLIALYHGLELLVKHGSRVFLNFFDEHPEKSWIQADDRLTALLERLRDDLGINPLSLDRSILPDGTVPEIPKNLRFGHPKFEKLKEIMLEHFNKAKQKGQDTKAIVFCEYRESVNLVHCLLLQCRPLITPQMFVGQGASGKDGKTMVSQKQQLRVMRNFREGACNALVATCVAEEGLDVGSVDLILCFDISTRSPVRLVQRCGRTGRERGGQVFILVTEGREHQTLMDCIRQKEGLNKKILQSRDVENNLYKFNPRMMPHDLTPQCQKMYITVTKKKDTKEKNTDGIEKCKKGQKDLRSMLQAHTSSSRSCSSTKEIDNFNFITEDEFDEIYPDGYYDTKHIVDLKEYRSMHKDTFKTDETQLKLATWLEWQKTLQKTINIGHSIDTEILTALLQNCDAKRFHVPASSQNPSFNTQVLSTQNLIMSPAKSKHTKKKQKTTISKSPSKNIGDIRALFSTTTKSTKSYTKFINELGIQNDGSIPTSLINLLVDLSLDNTNTIKQCYICQNVCDCALLQTTKKDRRNPSISLNFLRDPKLPNLDLIDDLDVDTILKCSKNLDKSYVLDLDIHKDEEKSDVNKKNDGNNNFDLEFNFDELDEFNLPEKVESKSEKLIEGSEKNFDIGDLEDIFADSSPEMCDKSEIVDDKDCSNPKEALGFFGLDSIDDIFADSDDDNISSPKNEVPNNGNSKNITDNVQPNETQNPTSVECPLSPSILSGRCKNNNISTSPILSSQVRKLKLSTKKNQAQCSTPVSNVKKKLDLSNDNVLTIPEENRQTSNSNAKNHASVADSSNKSADISNKSMFTITQLVEMINKTEGEKSIFVNKNTSKEMESHVILNVDERRTSPILLTQAEKKKISLHDCSLNVNLNDDKHTSPVLSTEAVNKKTPLDMNDSLKSQPSQYKNTESLIILDSDSDSDNTVEYNIEKINNSENNEFKSKNLSQSPVGNKRKFVMEDSDFENASPFFNKRQKLDNESNKSLTLQEKVLAALTANDNDKTNFGNNDSNVNYMTMNFLSQKENKDPLQNHQSNSSDDEKKYVRSNNLDMLQMFRRQSNDKRRPKRNSNILFRSSQNKCEVSQKTLASDESDDDFVNNKTRQRSQMPSYKENKGEIKIKNHKMQKKRKKDNEFLDLEAELSDNAGNSSGDELSDDSVGSIAEFICDENITHHEDMQAHYMRSVKSPVKGVFKIPELPKKFNNANVFSQFVEEDSYEMDSFCVDSHIGLTQANDISELELAEMLLEEERRNKKKRTRNNENHVLENGDSPEIKRKTKNVKRQIHSDSDDSS